MKYLYPIFLTFFLVACAEKYTTEEPYLVSLNIIDRNGLSETIAAKERLEKYANTDFNENQPYQKVLRTYSKDCANNSLSVVTSYYPNGQIKQSLDAINNRAFGLYKEWHENGFIKLEATIIGGIADLTPAAEKSWEFEGVAKAWDDENHLLTAIGYKKGFLEGDSLYYHKNGNLWKKIPYLKNGVTGTAEYYLENGDLLQTLSFCNNEPEGVSQRFWSDCQIAAEEFYCKGKLMTGSYFDSTGAKIAEIINGEGYRAAFGKYTISELQEFHKGSLSGLVRVFDENSLLVRSYLVQDGVKNGEEYAFFPPFKNKQRPNLMITWYQGKIQGFVKTWYENGNLESQKEMLNNKKHGVASAWYKDGSLMMIEEYEQDRLIKGEYYKPKETVPLTQVFAGKGTATLFDPDGRYIRKITYQNGKPVDKN